MKTENNIQVTQKSDYKSLRIDINGLPHIIFPRHKRIAYQAWYEGTEKEGRVYKFELHNGDINSEYHYDNAETWKKVITLVSKII